MDNQDMSFLEAIRMAIEAEQKAVDFLTDAAQRTANPLARALLEELAEFDRYHHAKLGDLERSLCENGACIMYEGRELTFQVPDEIERLSEADRMSAMGIMTVAIDIKRKAEERYTALAKQTTDPLGQAMLTRLAEEERANRRVLDEAYWSVNNRRAWTWSKQTARATN
jgi:rubrerythrin